MISVLGYFDGPFVVKARRASRRYFIVRSERDLSESRQIVLSRMKKGKKSTRNREKCRGETTGESDRKAMGTASYDDAEKFVEFSDMRNVRTCQEKSGDAGLILRMTGDGEYAIVKN